MKGNPILWTVHTISKCVFQNQKLTPHVCVTGAGKNKTSEKSLKWLFGWLYSFLPIRMGESKKHLYFLMKGADVLPLLYTGGGWKEISKHHEHRYLEICSSVNTFLKVLNTDLSFPRGKTLANKLGSRLFSHTKNKKPNIDDWRSNVRNTIEMTIGRYCSIPFFHTNRWKQEACVIYTFGWKERVYCLCGIHVHVEDEGR